MNPYYEILYTVMTHQPCTKFHIENLRHGKFKQQFDECLQQKYIEGNGTNENGDTLYYITEPGLQIVNK